MTTWSTTFDQQLPEAMLVRKHVPFMKPSYQTLFWTPRIPWHRSRHIFLHRFGCSGHIHRFLRFLKKWEVHGSTMPIPSHFTRKNTFVYIRGGIHATGTYTYILLLFVVFCKFSGPMDSSYMYCGELVLFDCSEVKNKYRSPDNEFPTNRSSSIVNAQTSRI